MKFSKLKLPSNKNFGLFFAFIFGLFATYFYVIKSILFVYIFALIAVILLLIALIKPDLLLPLNKLWMRFGLLLGFLVNPVVLGIVFFGLFTPIAFLMRIMGRDELKIKMNIKASHWKIRDHPIKSHSFKNQF